MSKLTTEQILQIQAIKENRLLKAQMDQMTQNQSKVHVNLDMETLNTAKKEIADRVEQMNKQLMDKILSATEQHVKSMVEKTNSHLSGITQPKDGKDAEVTQEMLDSVAKQAASLIAKPQDGKDAEVTDELVQAIVSDVLDSIDIPNVSALSEALEAQNKAMKDGLQTVDKRIDKAIEDAIKKLPKTPSQGGTNANLVRKIAQEEIASSPTTGGDSVKVSSNDTTAGFLNGKLVAGTNITLTENSDGGNETLTIAASGGAGHDEVTVTDSAEIDFTLTGQNITASLIAGSIDESKLDTSVNASLDLADGSVQSVVAGTNVTVDNTDPANPIVSASGGGTTNNINNMQVDQAGTVGSGSAYGALAGTLDGANKVFTVSNGSYVSGTLVVFLMGANRYMGSTADFQETSPAAGTFTFTTAPESTDRLLVIYQTTSTSSADLLNTREWVSKTADYTLLTTDRGADVDTTSAVVSITLPTASSSVGKGTYYVRKNNAGANDVTVARQGSDTIDGSTSDTISTQFEVKGYEAISSSAWVTVS